MGNRGMDDLIVVVNQLQDAFAQLGRECPIDLPQIAVVGGQSAGKSSVLENFVGKDFLPRGSGIVTRRPLILQLLHHSGREYGEFLHQPGKKYTDFNDIRKEIEAETDRMTGSNKGISDIPINLKVYSPHVLDLTLVDLPGITKVPVGDQPKDIEHQIRNMIMEFITKPNCLILAVTPANSDLANSDALKLAKEVDPQGNRTIGVITKLDLMDQGTDAREILENKLLPLKRGYVGVVNRSQADIDGNKDIRKAMAAEKQFFATHPAYRHIAAKMGTPRLQQVLNQQLVQHIKETLPELRNQLQAEVIRLEKECAEFKGMDAVGKGASTKMMMTYMHTFSDDWWKSIDGGGEINLDELSGGAKINRIFFERFPYELNKSEYDERQLRREITYAIKNIHGVRSGLFTPDEAFEAVCKKLIERMRAPALNCVELSMNELCDITSKVAEKVARFPRLRDELERITQNAIKENYQITCEQTDMLVNCEVAYINTMHPEFIGYQQATAPAQGQNFLQKKPGEAPKTVNMGNQVVRRGYLSTPSGMTNQNKEYWFVLNSDSMAWYKDEQEQEQKYNLKLAGCKVREHKSSSWTGKTRYAFEIFNPEMRFLYKDNQSLVLFAASADEMEAWKASLLRVGVFPSNKGQEDDAEQSEENLNLASLDPVLERQVENIRSLVDSYQGIVGTTVRDLVPKTIMCFLVNTVKEFLKTDLIGSLYAAGSPEDLMEESADETQRREDMLKMLKLTKDALKLLADVNVSNIGTSSYNEDSHADSYSATRAPSSPPPSRLPPRPTSGGGVSSASADKPSVPSKPAMPSRPEKPNKPNIPSRPQRP